MKLLKEMKRGMTSPAILSDIINTAGGAYGIANIKETIGLVITIIVAINAIINISIRIVNATKKFKEGDKEGAKEDVKEAIKDGKEVYDTVKPVVEDFLDDGELNGSNKKDNEVK